MYLSLSLYLYSWSKPMHVSSFSRLSAAAALLSTRCPSSPFCNELKQNSLELKRRLLVQPWPMKMWSFWGATNPIYFFVVFFALVAGQTQVTPSRRSRSVSGSFSRIAQRALWPETKCNICKPTMAKFNPRWRQWWQVFCQRCRTTDPASQASSSPHLTRWDFGWFEDNLMPRIQTVASTSVNSWWQPTASPVQLQGETFAPSIFEEGYSSWVLGYDLRNMIWRHFIICRKRVLNFC